MIYIAKWTVIVFGLYIIGVAILMLFAPAKARQIIGRAGSTNFINYAEITIRMIPAIALILFASSSRYPYFFSVFGWVMLGTSLILYFVPRKIHHSYSSKSASILKPLYLRLLSPVTLLFGLFIVYCAW